MRNLPLFAEGESPRVDPPPDEPKQAASPNLVNDDAQQSNESDSLLGFAEWALTRLVEEFADAARARISRKVILGLRRIPGMQREAGWKRATAWDEICVQVQTEESFYWELAYISTIEQLIGTEIQSVSKCEMCAMWLQTQEGSDWLTDLDFPDEEVTDQTDYTSVPYDNESVVALILRNVLNEAANYENARIRSYVDELRS